MLVFDTLYDLKCLGLFEVFLASKSIKFLKMLQANFEQKRFMPTIVIVPAPWRVDFLLARYQHSIWIYTILDVILTMGVNAG